MKRELRIFTICIAIAFIIWTIPFSLRLSSDFDHHEVHKTTKTTIKENSKGIANEILTAYSVGNKKKAFHLIFSNNIKVSVINIFGGIFLGLGTLGNLAQNGFLTANVFCSLHKGGLSWSRIIEYTAPHSIEMIGIWLSGGLGFYIARLLIIMMVKNKAPGSIDLKIIIGGMVSVVLIIAFAAYVEAYVSVV